jgi:CSLREA domain-containing protein
MLKRLALGVATTLIAVVGFAPSAGATTMTVVDDSVATPDDQFGEQTFECTLREAIQAANSNAAFGGCPAGQVGAFDPDTINVPAGATYSLGGGVRSGVDNTNSAGDLDITDTNLSITASGGGQGGTVINCNACGDRVFDIASSAFGVTIAGLRISGGNTTGSGGGISSTSKLNLLDVTLNGNTAGTNGGAIFHSNPSTTTDPLSLRNVTITGNTAAGRGGGIAYNSVDNSFFKNSTIVGNTGDSDESGSPEDTGAGINNFGSGVTQISNTILAGNGVPGVDGGDECSANVTSGNNNILGDGGNCTSFTLGTNDLVGSFFGGEVPADLGGLGNYGGTVWTMQPNRTSPAINRGYLSGPGTTCESTDARGLVSASFNRPQEGRCDIGAVEYLNPGPQTLTPTTQADQLDLSPTFSGPCSLREAVTATNTNQATGGCPAGTTASDTINVAPGTYTLTRAGVDDTNLNGDLDLLSGDTLTINAVGPGQTTINGNGAVTNDRVLQTSGSFFGFIDGLNIQNGKATGNGGGLENAGELDLSNVTVSGNTATGDGGGIHFANNTFGDIENSTVSGNQANGNGGGIASANTVNTTPRLHNVTVTGNTAANGGGLLGTAPGFPLSNTIVAGNTDASGGEAPDCAGTISSTGYNLIGTDGGCTFGATTGDQVGSNVSPLAAGLSGLANNGGTSLTHAPVLGSLVLNAGNPAAPFLPPACLQTDQIGTVRPLNGRCDIGALESNPSPVTGGGTLGGTTAAPAAKKKCKKKAKKTAVAAKKCKKKKK